MPDSTDLSPWHGRLARELAAYDLIHTTDGYFAFARTAAKISARYGIPLTTSFHTDTPSYARIFTRQTIDSLTAGWPALRDILLDNLDMPEKQGRAMERKLAAHVRASRYALWTRDEDRDFAEHILGAERVKPLRLGIDKKMFGPHRANREGVCARYGMPKDKIIILFVGRVDVGKNIYTLIEACEKLLGRGVPLHLAVAGVGPAEADVKSRLGQYASLLGYVKPDNLAALYASVDALALVSEVEIRSMVGGEALVSGCPVLVSAKSGIAPLFGNTTAMRVVEGGSAPWAEALNNFAANPDACQSMRATALDYAAGHLPGWGDVLAQDLFPIWQKAAAEAKRKAA